jgi:TolB-like protein/AraC-like DNA-binding protein/Tfp pilus assembly protein PilF
MQKDFLQHINEIIEANLSNEKFGIEELSSKMGMNRMSLYRKIKSSTNKSGSQFIRELRLEKGKELLENEDITVSEVSYRVGFGSPTYFSKCFREYFGVAPGELKTREPVIELVNVPVEQPEEHTPKKIKRTNILIGLVVLLLVLIPVSVYIASNINLSKETIEDKSIAVLPFKYLSDEPAKQYLADGLMDAVLTKLSKIKDLRVVSRTSVEQYRESYKTSKVIGQEQNVAYILEGSFQKENNEVRLILQLIKTRDENHVWSNIYDRQWKDIFIVQSEVAETVARQLQAVITPQEQQLIRKTPTTNLTAYDFYQRGVDVLEKYEFGIQKDSIDLKKAQQHFQKALELDSTYALAYTGLAAVCYSKYYWKTFLSENFMDSALIYANMALEYDPQCADAHFYRAKVYSQTSKTAEALKEIDIALQLNPNDYKAYTLRSEISRFIQDNVGEISNYYEAMLRNHASPGYLRRFSTILGNCGYTDLGRTYLQQALELDGDSATHLFWLATMEYSDGNIENAYQIAKTNNDYYKDLSWDNRLAPYCLMTGRIEEAYEINLKMMESLKKAGEMDLFVPKEYAYCLWHKGRTKEAEVIMNELVQTHLETIKLGRYNAITKRAQFDLAEIYSLLGNKGKAYYYLDEVNKKPAFPVWWVTSFKIVPYFDNIRQEPRFQKILKDVEAKYQAEHERVGKWLKGKSLL